MSQSLPNRFFEKLQNQELTEEDRVQFIEWLHSAPESEVEAVLEKHSWYFQSLPDEPLPANSHLAALIEEKLNKTKEEVVVVLEPVRAVLWPALRWAAGLVAVIAFACLFYVYFKVKKPAQFTTSPIHHSKIVPGENKATLTLDDGSIISLDSAKNGMLARQSNVQIYKSKSGKLVYDTSLARSQNGGRVTYNIVSIPRGGQFQVVLPDGTKVWLNASSSLRYPTSFIGKERAVELTGEAYFEVAKDKAHPFRVSINNMQVEVLGTHFNIMGYTDEASTQTTLLEGSVKVIRGNEQKMIVPGEQAAVAKNINIAKVNVNEVVEWKNGNFNFSHEKLESIMRKIARWYNVDIAYEGKVSKNIFVGTIPRSKDITVVLKYLELTELVHFKVIERRIIVMP